ncbi:hypothetical protein [Pseudomonas putida]
MACLADICRPNVDYAKAEVLLMGLCQRGEFTDDLFAERQVAASEQVMGVLDAINAEWGPLRPARVPATPTWGATVDEPELYDSTGPAVVCSLLEHTDHSCLNSLHAKSLQIARGRPMNLECLHRHCRRRLVMLMLSSPTEIAALMGLFAGLARLAYGGAE